MGIKGQAKIELTDVNTGKKSVVRHDNMVTNAITKFFNNCGPHANPFESGTDVGNKNYFTNPKNSFVTELFGGLYLFDGALDESDPNDYAIPSNVSCVGYGARGANSSINTMLGSYNEAESGLQEDGSYRFVWDFLTSQANGVISSLALAPPDVTIMGWDNKMNEKLDSIGTNHSFWFNPYSLRDTPDVDAFLFYDDEYIYSIQSCNLYFSSNYVDRYFVNSKKLYIEKRRLVNKKVSIFGSYPFDTLPSEVIEVALPEEILSKYNSPVTSAPTTYIHVEYDSGHIYLYVNNSQSVSSGGTFNLLKINVDNWTTSVLSVTNTTGKIWYFGSSSNRTFIWVSGTKMRIMNGHIILSTGGTSSSSTKTQTFIINLADNTNVREVFYEDEATPTGMTCTGIKYNDFLFIYGNTNGTSNLKVINIMTAKVFDFYNTSGHNCFCPFENRGGVSYTYSSNIMIQNKDNQESFIYYYYYDSKTNNEIAKTLNPLCLMTKNNLLEPVTKTSAQTMKVIYTISEVV